MKLITGVMISMALLLSQRLTGPEPGHEDAYLGIEIAGFEALDRSEALRLDALINGRSFIYKDTVLVAKLTFRNGTFVLRCDALNTYYSETLHGSYFITRTAVNNKPAILLKRSGNHWMTKDRRPSPLSMVQKVLDLNTILTVHHRKNLISDAEPCLPDKLSLRGFYTFRPSNQI